LKSELAYADIKVRELENRILENDTTIDSLNKQLEKKIIDYNTKCA
jgi:hypothetical protein